MSTNQDKQSEIEQESIERVKNLLLDSMDITPFFGFSTEEIQFVWELLKTIKKNQQKSVFPDFLVNDGFIEHFTISSSKETRKGSSHKVGLNAFERANEEVAKNLTTDEPTKATYLHYKDHSHDELKKSIKRHWNKHIESLNRYEGKKANSIFLIDYHDELALSMSGCIDSEAVEMSIGDYPINENFDGYRLSRDKEMLKWIFEFENQIKYVIFQTPERVEVINVKNIQKLLTALPYNYYVCSNMTTLSKKTQLLYTQKNKTNITHE